MAYLMYFAWVAACAGAWVAVYRWQDIYGRSAMRDKDEPPARAVQSVVWVVARLCLRGRLGPLDCASVLPGVRMSYMAMDMEMNGRT